MSSQIRPYILLGLVALAASGAGEEVRKFADRFDGDLGRWGEVRGRWAVQEGVLVHQADWDTARLTFPETSIGDFRLNYRLRFDRIDPALRAGILVARDEGYWLVTIRASGSVSWAFIVKGQKSGLFQGGLTADFQGGEWADVSMACQEGRLTMQVNGRSAVVGPAPGSGRVSLQARLHMSLDDVNLMYDTATESFRNRQLNGSFEFATNPDVPDGWGLPVRWTRMSHGLPLDALLPGGMSDYRENWLLDRTTAYHGKSALRVRHPLGAVSMPMLLQGTNDYTVSVYLKSDSDRLRVRLAADDDDRGASIIERTVEVGRNWQRVSLLVPAYDRSRLAVAVMPQAGGFLWLDAVQIETGRVATAYTPSWYDTGFSLPHYAAHIEPGEAYPDKTHVVSGPAQDVSIVAPTLAVQDPAGPLFALGFSVTNASADARDVLLTTTVEVELQEPTVATRALRLAAGAAEPVSIPGIAIANDRFRCRVIHTLGDADGQVIRRERRFLDVPQPLRIYPEFSHYTEEKTARFMVQQGLPASMLTGAVLACELRLAIQRSETYGIRTVPVQPGARRQWVELPIRGNGWMDETPYEVVARLLDEQGRVLAHARCDLKTLPPAKMDVRVNHVNRGLYVNGEPCIPYGVYFTGALPNAAQLRGYRAVGFDFVGVLGHRTGIDALKVFLADCDEVGVRACVTQLSRKYGLAASAMADLLRGQPALILFNPVDETGQPNVYPLVDAAQHRLPHIPCFVNENTAGYQAFSSQLRGFPGPILSCDRYPLIGQPYGWPQTSADVNGIYSFEERIAWMDLDGERDRKPLHYYLQAAEHTLREPTPAELAWLTYIPLVNRCLAFTYFDGLPHSQAALDAMVQLNREVQSLKPALFSLEEEPRVEAANPATGRTIRMLAKTLDGELTVICVNRALRPVDAVLDLASAGIAGAARAEVLFENRTVTADAGGRLADRFEPLARHVYRIRKKEKGQ